MHVDPSYLGSLSALFGALTGGSASLVAAIYTQRFQIRLQRMTSEVAKREGVYADFVMTASATFLSAYVQNDIALGAEEQRMVGLINRMKLFAPPEVVEEAEKVLRTIVAILLRPGVEIRQLAKVALSDGLDPDPLQAFSSVCRADLDKVRTSLR